jgi:hypothetical protein
MLVLAWRSTSVVAGGGSPSALHAVQEAASVASAAPLLAPASIPLLEPAPLLDPELLLPSIVAESLEPASLADEPELPLPPHEMPVAVAAAKTTSIDRAR